MFFGVFGLFLAAIGVSTASIGAIEGVVEGISYVLKVVSGIVSDYIKKRKLILSIGSFCTALSKVIAALFVSSNAVVIGRIIDRIGNGLQATPRDAIVSDYAPSKIVGTCFGIRQCLGTSGSVLGALLLSVLLGTFQNNFRLVFTIAGAFALSAFVLVALCVHDVKKVEPLSDAAEYEPPMAPRFLFKNVLELDRVYWTLMIAVAIFMSCRISETLIILYAKKTFSLEDSKATRVMLVYNIFAALAAYWTGRLGDKRESTRLMIIGTLITTASITFMGLATIYEVFLGGVMLWGVQIGVMQNVFCSEISHIVSKNSRGTGFGIFYLITATSILIANVVCGRLMNNGGARAFAYCAVASFISFIAILLLSRSKVWVNRRISMSNPENN
jgi:MFS family permease